MAKVIKAFQDKTDEHIYYAGEQYNGDRVEELADAGFVEADDENKEPEHKTVKELKAELDAAGIEYNPKAKKDELEELAKGI